MGIFHYCNTIARQRYSKLINLQQLILENCNIQTKQWEKQWGEFGDRFAWRWISNYLLYVHKSLEWHIISMLYQSVFLSVCNHKICSKSFLSLSTVPTTSFSFLWLSISSQYLHHDLPFKRILNHVYSISINNFLFLSIKSLVVSIVNSLRTFESSRSYTFNWSRTPP